MNNKVSHLRKATFDGTRGILAKHQLNLPSLYQQYLGCKVWDFNSPKSWHFDTMLKLVWSPEIQERTYNTGVFTLQQILKKQSTSRADLQKEAVAQGYSWVTIRNVVLPRLKRLGMIRESKIDSILIPSSDFAQFFKKLANEWMRELADFESSPSQPALLDLLRDSSL